MLSEYCHALCAVGIGETTELWLGIYLVLCCFMLKIIRRCFDFARSVLLSGRAGGSPSTDDSPTPYWMIKEAAFTNLKPGVSTRDDVLRELGVPLLKSQFPRQGEEVWEYRYLQGAATFMLAYVYFDLEGTYKYSSHLLDPAEYGGG